MTGAAESEWTLGTLDLDSEAQVLQTARMVREEWRIQVQAPGAVACVRSDAAKTFAAEGSSGADSGEVAPSARRGS
jgi:hypothetical protein